MNTRTVTNEAAERLLTKWVVSGELPRAPKGGWTVPRLIAYLEADTRVAERKVIFERLRIAFRDWADPDLAAILDAEAAR